MRPRILSKTRRLALISVLAVVYNILRLIPVAPMIGYSGFFSLLSDSMAAVYGVVFGASIAVVSVIVGTFMAIALGRPAVFLGLDFIPAATSALIVGLIVERRRFAAALLYVTLLILFLLHPYSKMMITVPSSGIEVPYVWMHLAALVVLLSSLTRRAVEWVNGDDFARLTHGLASIVFVGVMAQHLAGGLLFETILGAYLGVVRAEAFEAIWSTVFWLYPFERVSIIAISVLIGAPLIRTLKTGRSRKVEICFPRSRG